MLQGDYLRLVSLHFLSFCFTPLAGEQAPQNLLIVVQAMSIQEAGNHPVTAV